MTQQLLKKTILLGFCFSLSASAQTKILRPEDIQTLAKKLKFKTVTEALSAYELFSQRVQSGFANQSWIDECRVNQHPSLCSVIEDYFKDLNRLKEKKPGTPSFRRVGTLSAKKIKEFQSEHFQALLEALPNKKTRQLEDFARVALKDKSCPQNLSLALAYELEHTLNKAQNIKLVEDLFEAGLNCAQPKDSAFELMNLRYALISVGLNKKERAITYFKKSLEAEFPREDYRSLYYLSKLLAESNADEAEKYFNSLLEKYPRSWYTIKLLSSKGLDPLKMNLRTSVAPDVYSLPNQALDNKFNWLKMGLLLEKDPYKLKKYAEYIADIVSPSMEFGFIQHMVRLLHSADLYKAQINILNRYLTVSNPPVTQEILEYLYPAPFLELFNLHGVELDTALLLGLARQESSFDVHAKSSANAWGLLQLLPSTAKHLGSKKSHGLWSATENIRFASKYLIRLAKRFENSIERSLAAYNAGPARVEEWEKDYSWVKDAELFVDLIPYRETRDYVPTILRNAYWYHRLYPGSLNVTKKEYVTSGLLKPLIVKFK